MARSLARIAAAVSIWSGSLPGVADTAEELVRMNPNPSDPDLRPDRSRALQRAAVLVALLLLAFYAAIPNLDGVPRRSANESAAIATLKNLRAGQRDLRERVLVDRDGDGVGEYGFLAQLAGVAELPGGGVADPPLASKAFGNVVDGRVLRSGYRFAMFLPRAGGGWLSELPDGGEPDGVDADAAERSWLLYAWPVAPRRSGRRSFVIDEHGDVHATGDHREPVPGVSAFCVVDGQRRLAHATADERGAVWVIVQ